MSLLEILERYNARHRCSNPTEKEQEDFEQETNRIFQHCSPAPIPRFYAGKTNPIHEHAKEALKTAARARDYERKLSTLSLFDEPVLKMMVKCLQPSPGNDGVTFLEFKQGAAAFRQWQKENGKVPSAAEVAACPPPVLDCNFFLTCPRNPEQGGRVSVNDVYVKLGRFVLKMKARAEIIVYSSSSLSPEHDSISEEDFEAYTNDLIPNTPALANLPSDLELFYCCSCSRRFFWALDSTKRGFLKIDDIMASPLMDEWLMMQLECEELPRNWFSCTVTQQLYDKFVKLDGRHIGMISRDDMRLYKKGVPMVIDDGLDRDVSPLSSLFLDRVFEVMSLYHNEMDFKKFLDFLIAVEFLPDCPQPGFFWNIFDIHDDGVLTPMVVNLFFKDTYEKLVNAGLQPAALEIIIPQLFDLIPSQEPLRVTKEEFCASTNVGLFSTLIIDCLAFWSYETRSSQ